MNIMLVFVRERTREIGIRMAIEAILGAIFDFFPTRNAALNPISTLSKE